MGERRAHRDPERSLARLADTLLAVALAPVCAACRRPLPAPSSGPVCPTCWGSVVLVPEARSHAHDGPLRDIIHAFKYEGRRTLAAPLADLVRIAAGAQLRDADCAVPVPLHPWRRLRRGFNQSSDLAGHLGLPVVHALWRVRWTKQQMGLAAPARVSNVRNAFRLSPLLRQNLQGRVIVLVDDVKTTGATLRACASVLRAAGAKDVREVTVAIRT